MKKLRAPSDGGIISNAEKADEIRVLRESQYQIIKQKAAAGRRIPQLLADIGNEFVVSDRFGPDPMPKLEAVLRVVYDMALDGNLWCVDFIANRMEGKPMQSITIHDEKGDVRDLSTDELIRQAQANLENAERLADLKIQALIEAGELVRVETPHRTL